MNIRSYRLPSRTAVTSATCFVLLSAMISGCSEPNAPVENGSAATNAAAATTAAATPPKSQDLGLVPIEVSFSDRRVPMTAAQACNLERVNGKQFSTEPVEVLKAASPIRFDGWLANVQKHDIPSNVLLRLQSTTTPRLWQAEIQTGVKRDAVAAHLGDSVAFANSGYSALINVTSIPAGSYRLYVAFREGNTMLFCGNGRIIDLKD